MNRLHEEVLVRGLDELWQRRIVRERGGDAYDFSHDKLRLSQVLQEIPRDQSWVREMERRWARLQNRWAASSDIALLACRRFEQYKHRDDVH
ncbi:MAG: hypothetical protein M3Y81_25885 [Chloroflexota bacterium]|nr:hypothetical protein [Chloroflexota bacterium]